MPIYEYSCDCGTTIEVLVAFGAPPPTCTACGAETRKAVSSFSVNGRADAGLSKSRMPQTWMGTYGGNSEYTTLLQRQWERRCRLEDRYPEIADDRRPVVAHEGVYSTIPLRAGEAGRSTVDQESTAKVGESDEGVVGGAHHHGHPHGHSHAHPARPQPPAA